MISLVAAGAPDMDKHTWFFATLSRRVSSVVVGRLGSQTHNSKVMVSPAAAVTLLSKSDRRIPRYD